MGSPQWDPKSKLKAGRAGLADTGLWPALSGSQRCSLSSSFLLLESVLFFKREKLLFSCGR